MLVSRNSILEHHYVPPHTHPTNTGLLCYFVECNEQFEAIRILFAVTALEFDQQSLLEANDNINRLVGCIPGIYGSCLLCYVRRQSPIGKIHSPYHLGAEPKGLLAF